MELPSPRKNILKRRRPVLSCAECRRLKLRCDRNEPCGSCIKRGCAEICPDGVLQAGKGTRYVLSNTQELHVRIEQLTNRIRYLENALSEAHHGSSTSIEPLHLRESIDDPTNTSGTKQDVELAHSFGTLFISEGGHSRWMGATATSESLLHPEDDSDDPTSFEYPGLSQHFPFSIDQKFRGATKDMVLKYLPPFEEASSLFETYLAHAGWIYQPFSRSELIRDTLRPAYGPDNLKIPSSNLALLFIVFAIGTLVDLTKSPYDPRAKTFYQLCRLSLTLEADDFFVRPTIVTIQTLHTMSLYLQMTNDKDDPASALVIIGVAVKLAQSLGLHRDPARLGDMDEEEVRARRRVWWELVTADAWQSMAFGRPASVFKTHFDCLHPNDSEETLGASTTFQRGKFGFTENCLLLVLEKALSATPPTYPKVLQLDKMIRDWKGPLQLDLETRMEEITDSAFSLQCYVSFFVRQISLLYLHRVFFSRTLQEHPHNPMKSRYRASFVAVYQSAIGTLTRIRSLYAEQPALMLRFWMFVTHAISSAVVLGALVSQSPSSNLAPAALTEFDLACQFFEKARDNSRIARALPTILILRQKAHQAFQQFKAGLWQPSALDGASDNTYAPGVSTGTKIVATKRTPLLSSPSSEEASTIDFEASDNIHPALAEYFQLFQQDTPTWLPTTAGFPPNNPQDLPIPWGDIQYPQLLAPIDPTIMSMYIPPQSFDDTFAAVDDNLVTQPMNEEWNRFMRLI